MRRSAVHRTASSAAHAATMPAPARPLYRAARRPASGPASHCHPIAPTSAASSTYGPRTRGRAASAQSLRAEHHAHPAATAWPQRTYVCLPPVVDRRRRSSFSASLSPPSVASRRSATARCGASVCRPCVVKTSYGGDRSAYAAHATCSARARRRTGESASAGAGARRERSAETARGPNRITSSGAYGRNAVAKPTMSDSMAVEMSVGGSDGEGESS